MNTLPRRLTTTVLGDATRYEALRRRWSVAVNSGAYDLHPAHYLLYLTLLGKDWRRAFTPITNTTRLENGGLYDWGFFRALNRLHSSHWSDELLAPFDGLVTHAHLRQIRQWVPRRSPHDFRAAEPGTWPCDAYAVGEAPDHA